MFRKLEILIGTCHKDGNMVNQLLFSIGAILKDEIGGNAGID